MAELLAGPILRRTTVDGAYLWLAFDAEVSGLQAEVFQCSQNGEKELIGRADPKSLSSVKLGKRFYLYLLKLVHDQGQFSKDKLYYYDVKSSTEGEEKSFIANEECIYYPNSLLPLPSFFIPTNHTHTLQASCRKPHAVYKAGKNVVDQCVKVDSLLAESCNTLASRPSQLFLTGDQVYADDVSFPLLLLCTSLGTYLTGVQELLPPIQSGGPKVNPYHGDKTDRRAYFNKATGFTTGHPEHHLMTFGEMVAMYLLVWGGLKPAQIQFPDYEEVKQRIPVQKKHIKALFKGQWKKSVYEQEVAVLNKFFTNARAMRRSMANIPSYMMFDDHDITDDWNLTKENANKMWDIPFSRRVVTNALAAYWAFQGWGNSPTQFEGAFIDYVQSAYSEHNQYCVEFLENLFINKRYWWGFSVPTNPPILALDTRTRRVFMGDKLALMDTQAFSQAEELLNQVLLPQSKTLLLLSPSPMFGFKAIEAVKLHFSKTLAAFIDRESWIADKRSLERLKKLLVNTAELQHIYVLSGDVHYGFHRHERDQRIKDGCPVHFWQLTSSACCNIPPGKTIGQSLVEKWIPGLRAILLRHFDRDWGAKYLMPEGRKEFITADTNIGVLVLQADGNPISSYLYLADAQEESESVWQYDLKSPQHFDV